VSVHRRVFLALSLPAGRLAALGSIVVYRFGEETRKL